VYEAPTLTALEPFANLVRDGLADAIAEVRVLSGTLATHPDPCGGAVHRGVVGWGSDHSPSAGAVA